MLAVLRFTFTKDLKFVHGKVCKPYNSVLGEHFRAHWDILPNTYNPDEVTQQRDSIGEPVVSETASVRSGKSGKSSKSGMSGLSAFSKRKSTSTAPTSDENLVARASNLSISDSSNTPTRDPSSVRVIYLTEQVSHHPPVSAYFASCPEQHLELSGIDQISAKVSGTTLRVAPGQFNQGIFVKITGGHGEGERYHITHPVASVNGILRGSFYVTVSESTIITCDGGKPGHKFRTIIDYKEESWLGRAHFLLEGVIHTVYEHDELPWQEWTKVKHVPQSRVVAVFDGSWRGKIRWRRVGLGSYPSSEHNGVTRSTSSSPSPSHVRLPTPTIPTSRSKFSVADITKGALVEEDWMPLIDLQTLSVMSKTVRPLEKQHERESRKLWVNVTDNLLKKEFSEATREKVVIEQRQRDEAAERKKKGIQFIPKYFENSLEKGYALLTVDGEAAVQEELKEDSAYCIEGTELKAELYQ
ncbi:hypothetical protein CPB84DRAFT_1769602 [Gymnopilus junonius]|uniref:Oxysterol-binding protein n=1 Tax=Gymnopilus junonius TaxID=109634 RepID=A0A9P5NUE7_GYMJU|nr:hypothetical protein CPB84DRAFT_1769602 [Gymnopilus junonius]